MLQINPNLRQENNLENMQNSTTDTVLIKRWIKALDTDPENINVKDLEMEMTKQELIEVEPCIQRMKQTMQDCADQEELIQTVLQDIENQQKQCQILHHHSQKLTDKIYDSRRESKSRQSRSVSPIVNDSTHSQSDIRRQNNGIKECDDTNNGGKHKHNKNSIYPSYMKYFDCCVNAENETKEESKSSKIKMVSRKDENYRSKYGGLCNKRNVAAGKTKNKKKKNKIVYIDGKPYDVEHLTLYCAMRLLFDDEKQHKKVSTQRRFKILSRRKDNESHMLVGDKEKIDNSNFIARREPFHKENIQ